jgi:hypothetical protein
MEKNNEKNIKERVVDESEKPLEEIIEEQQTEEDPLEEKTEEQPVEEEPIEEQFIEEESFQEELTEHARRIQEITFRLHEIDLVIDEYEEKLFVDNDSLIEEQEQEQIMMLKKEYKQLKREMKALYRTAEGKFWEKVPVWMFVYGIVQIIISSFLIMPWLTVYAFDAFSGSMAGMLESNIGIFFMIFGVTFINLFITGVILYFVFKDKLKRTVISVIWGLQFLSSITTFLTLWNTYINFINWS